MLQVEQSTRSTNRSIQSLAKSGIPGETIRESLISQSVELIFTAHPTQVRQYARLPYCAALGALAREKMLT